MKRRFDWRSRLHAEISLWRQRSFVWGESDCARFVNACVLAMTGDDVLSALPFKPYRDDAEASASLASAGFESLPLAISSIFVEVQASAAKEGDVVLIDTNEWGQGLGIVLGERVAVLTMSGLGTIPRKRIKRAFRVP